MKILTIAALTLCIIGCISRPVAITISTVGATDSLVYLSRPVENFPLGVTDTIVVVQPVTVEISVSELSTVYLKNGEQFTMLIIEPGKEYKVEFNSFKPAIIINDSAQMILNRIFADKSFYKYEFVSNFTVAPLDTVATRMLVNFEELMAHDKAQFNAVEMSSGKHAFINKHIELFWMASLSKVLRANFLNSMRNGTQMYDGYEELWAKIYERYPLTEQMTPSDLLDSYADLLAIQKLVASKEYSMPKTYDEYLQEKYDGLYKNITNAKIRKTILAASLYLECLNNKRFEEAIIPHVEKFNKEYPGNAYKTGFDKFINNIKVFQQQIKANFSPEMKFVADGDSIRTFDKVIVQFRGKPVFVDFWFSTCRPCCEQFGYNAPLKKFLKENGIEMLYVSIDSREIDWHNAIKHYNLEGYHVRTRRELHQDIEKMGVVMFPRYMVIDANGEIVMHEAKWPNEGEALFTQIKEALN